MAEHIGVSLHSSMAVRNACFSCRNGVKQTSFSKITAHALALKHTRTQPYSLLAPCIYLATHSVHSSTVVEPVLALPHIVSPPGENDQQHNKNHAIKYLMH